MTQQYSDIMRFMLRLTNFANHSHEWDMRQIYTDRDGFQHAPSYLFEKWSRLQTDINAFWNGLDSNHKERVIEMMLSHRVLCQDDPGDYIMDEKEWCIEYRRRRKPSD